jgi:hypothetical protein
MMSCPIEKCSIYFRGISLPVFIFSDPDTDIDFTRFEEADSTSTDESIRSFFEDMILELFSSGDLFFRIFYIDQFLLICRKYRADIEILICSTKFLL